MTDVLHGSIKLIPKRMTLHYDAIPQEDASVHGLSVDIILDLMGFGYYQIRLIIIVLLLYCDELFNRNYDNIFEIINNINETNGRKNMDQQTYKKKQRIIENERNLAIESGS